MLDLGRAMGLSLDFLMTGEGTEERRPDKEIPASAEQNQPIQWLSSISSTVRGSVGGTWVGCETKNSERNARKYESAFEIITGNLASVNLCDLWQFCGPRSIARLRVARMPSHS